MIFILKILLIDGVPYWDTGAPGLQKMGDYLNRPADPYNAFEPVDSSAAAIASQGLLRLGKYLKEKGEMKQETVTGRPDLCVVNTLLEDPYLSTSAEIIRDCCFIPFIIVRTDGIIYLKEAKYHLENPVCGAITISVKCVSIFSG